MSSEMRKATQSRQADLLHARKDELCFMLNQRAGTPVKAED